MDLEGHRVTRGCLRIDGASVVERWAKLESAKCLLTSLEVNRSG